MRKKRELTQNLLDQLPQEQKIDLNLAMKTWWYNLRDSGGYRLTDNGYFIFKQFFNFEHYEHTLVDNPIKDLKLLLKLDRQLQAPYYLVKRKGLVIGIAFFSGKEAVLASLYGDIDKFLTNYR